MSFILKLIKGLGLLGGLFALMYAGLLVLTGPVPRYNVIVPKVTDDLVQFCSENAGIRVFKPVEGVKSMSSDSGSICILEDREYFLFSDLGAIEFREGIFLGGANCPVGETPKRSGWYRYSKIYSGTRESSSVVSVHDGLLEGAQPQIHFEAIRQPEARYHLHFFEDLPILYDEKRKLIKSGIAIHDTDKDERISEVVKYRVIPNRAYYQPIVAYFNVEPLYRGLYSKNVCGRIISNQWKLVEATINSTNLELEYGR